MVELLDFLLHILTRHILGQGTRQFVGAHVSIAHRVETIVVGLVHVVGSFRVGDNRSDINGVLL